MAVSAALQCGNVSRDECPVRAGHVESRDEDARLCKFRLLRTDAAHGS